MPCPQGRAFLKIPKGMIMEIIVKEVPNPSQGQQAISQDGRLCVFHQGKWITQEEYDRGIYIKLADQGDCV